MIISMLSQQPKIPMCNVSSPGPSGSFSALHVHQGNLFEYKLWDNNIVPTLKMFELRS